MYAYGHTIAIGYNVALRPSTAEQARARSGVRVASRAILVNIHVASHNDAVSYCSVCGTVVTP